ncbi:unnamed protein product [Rangifer tarandus platyrhynchus]|uniref:Uncharacterized protein n=1 Tax=Rangifer tarandus platyrhynchus TaxID=3082113 RepID=A0AC59YCR5_RANTA
MNLPKGPDTLCFDKDEFMKWLPPGEDSSVSPAMAHLKHQSTASSLLDHRGGPDQSPNRDSSSDYMNNTSEEKDYNLGLPEEEEGITCYIHYCPKDDSYLQAPAPGRWHRKPHLPLAPRTPPRSEPQAALKGSGVTTVGPPQLQPLLGWVAGAPTPAADRGCLCAAREPLHIRLPGNQTTVGSPSGAPLACLRQSQGLAQPQPHITPFLRPLKIVLPHTN